MGKVLIVEDERDISELMSLHLKREGFDVATVDNGEQAWQKLVENRYDVVILDWMLPGLSGLEICKKIRSEKENPTIAKLPVLMLTARAHTSDIVLGLELGADDYLTKPFEIPILVARVKSLKRRSEHSDSSRPKATKYQLGELFLDTESYKTVCGKKEIQLTPSEFRLLIALVENQGRVLTREKLIDMVQGEGVTVIDRAIDTHIFGLRKKLGKCAEVVETIRGVGYRIKTEA